jgi:crotonobetainyl-CoA:carnitine CoA-transferase CaiB-like acyl-CoA transferase
MDSTQIPASVQDAGPLSDISVVEFGEGVAAALAAKLMAMMGARVIKTGAPRGRQGPTVGPIFGRPYGSFAQRHVGEVI